MYEFQLTHPTRGATIRICTCPQPTFHFNSHTPHGVRPVVRKFLYTIGKFQLTHPTRGATGSRNKKSFCKRFQLTHPTRGATGQKRKSERAEADFNSHTPHGVRQEIALQLTIKALDFNSHTPHGVRQSLLAVELCIMAISTHTPHTGCDIATAFP